MERKTRDSRYPYFAYGSNMDSSQMEYRCPDSRQISKAELPGFRFILNSCGVATIVPDDSSTVHGVLWETTAEDEASLDHYEGVRYGTYSKEYMDVKVENGELVQALVYIAADSSEGEPGNGYMRRIIQAAEKTGFPQTYVDELTTWIQDGRLGQDSL